VSRRGASRAGELAAAEARRWRDPRQVAAAWEGAGAVDPKLLRMRASGAWWDLLGALGGTLLVGREYEHLVLALRVEDGTPRVSYLPLPHPSGIAVDAERRRVHVASTRNPNQVVELRPVTGALERADAPPPEAGAPLVPVRSWLMPGCLYLHDLALVGDALHAAAAGENAILRLAEDGGRERVWWPRSLDRADGGPSTRINHLQLNSIAAGPTLAESFFTASAAAPGARRPGQRGFAVDGRGVLFAGGSREPVVTGLTRPHSARLRDGVPWVLNSGYGEVGPAGGGAFEPLARLPGWTRGLCFAGGLCIVGTSRILPRFEHYAPGLPPAVATCAVHALDPATGRALGSLRWPAGNQIFAIEWLPEGLGTGLPFTARPAPARTRRLFYSFTTA
jgi:uncharacterized protein (TIGR03032 family)